MGEPATGKPMLGWIVGKIDCLSGIHDWSPEDLNEFTKGGMNVGDEATIRCKRCNRQIVTIEQRADGAMKWTAHVKEAVIYELTDEYKRKQGQKHDLDKFREDNK